MKMAKYCWMSTDELEKFKSEVESFDSTLKKSPTKKRKAKVTASTPTDKLPKAEMEPQSEDKSAASTEKKKAKRVRKPKEQAIAEESVEEEYKVEAILDHQKMKKSGVVKYLVKWDGYTSDFNTWEPEENLANSEELLNSYKNERGLPLKN